MSRCLLSLCICAVATYSAFAHETSTHQNIGNVAVAYLQQTNPQRPVLPSLQALLRIGAVQEDDMPFSGYLFSIPVGRYYFHFYPPLNFSIPGAAVSGSCRSDEWGLNDSPACTTTCIIPLVCNEALAPKTNIFRWSQDLNADSTGAPSAMSITQIGYVIHLLEDLGSPAHTRNDFHPCPFGVLYCDPFERYNAGFTPVAPTGSPIISTTGFTSPDDYFVALQSYTSTYYYSDNTVFQGSGPGLRTEDLQYFYGDCIAATNAYGVCEPSINGVSFVRKIAAKGPLYWGFCAAHGFQNCDNTKASIDNLIAHEQFAELGPVIAQHVASFIQFYGPALSVQLQGSGTGTGTVTSQVAGNPASLDCGTICSALFVNGAMVTLTANPGPGSSFTGWSGACSGTNAATTITLGSDATCVANFSPSSGNTLTVVACTLATIVSVPPGINCTLLTSNGCSATFPIGSTVTLNTVPPTVEQWTGGALGPSVGVLMDQPKAVLAQEANVSCI